MAKLDGYICDAPKCKNIGRMVKLHNYPYTKFPEGWWSVTPLGQDNDPEVCSLDCLIAWAEAEKKKPKPAKKKAAPKKNPKGKLSPRIVQAQRNTARGRISSHY